MARRYNTYLCAFVVFASAVFAQDDEPETQEPSYNCIGGPAAGLEAACDFNNFDGLNGRSPSEIIYEIIREANKPNDTFYPNDEHITCLFQDSGFLLDFGGEAGPVSIDITIDHPGTICAFVKDVPEGGMDLEQIRVLSRTLINECGKCGRMSVNYLSQNETQLGWLEFDWKNNPICQDNCINPETDLVTSNGTNSTEGESGEENEDGGDSEGESEEGGSEGNSNGGDNEDVGNMMMSWLGGRFAATTFIGFWIFAFYMI